MMFKILVLVSLCLSLSAFADWEGTVNVKIPVKQGPQNFSGKIHVKGAKQRIDMEQPLAVSTILDGTHRKAWNLMHAQKLSMEMNFEEAKSQIPECLGEKIDECFKKLGYKKVGSEKMNDHACDVYESETMIGNQKAKVKLWKPTDLKEVPAVRAVAKDDKDQEYVTDITGIKTKTQAASLFVVPRGYKSMGNMNQMIEQFKKNNPVKE